MRLKILLDVIGRQLLKPIIVGRGASIGQREKQDST